MCKIYALAAEGTEEGELLNVVDILRRSGLTTEIISITDSLQFRSSHNIHLYADHTIDSVDLNDAEMLFIPGGMPGAEHLSKCKSLISAIAQFIEDGKHIAAICAAPAIVLGRHGFLRGKKATCYPGFESELIGAKFVDEKVVTDGLFTTAKGLGCSFELSFEIIKILLGKEVSLEIAAQIQYLL